MRTLDIINQLAIKSEVFSFDDFTTVHGGSPSAASNALRRLVDMGVVDRVARGSYVIRQMGRMHTRAATEDIALVVGARFGHTAHRIAYRSALDFHGLLTRSVNDIQLAATAPVTDTHLGGRPLRAVSESASTIDIGSVAIGHGAHVSDVERSLIDAARRVDLVGVSTIADALNRLSVNDYDPALVVRYGTTLDLRGALRRLGSIASHTHRSELADAVRDSRSDRHLILADPGMRSAVAWEDPDFKVAWHQDQLDELGIRELVG